MIYTYPLTIQTLDSHTKEVSMKTFETKEEFHEYASAQFKLPGEYNLKNTKVWQSEYLKWKEHGQYCEYIEDSRQYNNYWDNQRELCISGIEIDGIYIPGFYYFYLNFLEIYDDVIKKFRSPNPWDTDLWFFHYVLLCMLEGKHAVVVKKRQVGFSFKIAALLYWSYVFFEGSINTIGASKEDYVKGTWIYFENYRDHVNSYTAWRRGPQVPKSLDWEEKTLTEDGVYVGNKSLLKGVTFQQSPTKAVGAAQTFFFYEEAGITTTMTKTVEFIRPKVEKGSVVTGMMILSGSVGELDQCEELKKIFYNPEGYNFKPVRNIWDESPEHMNIGLFVPENYSMIGFIDSEGNSLREEAKEYVIRTRELAKASKGAEDYQLAVSQKPLNPREAFAYRKQSYFPQGLITRHIDRLTIGEEKLSLKEVVLFENEKGEIKWRFRDDSQFESRPINKFPLGEGEKVDKRGCVVIRELPSSDKPEMFTYFAGVDDIQTDKSTTSESLFSIVIWKNIVETKYNEGDLIKTKVSGNYPVAWYTGRSDDMKDSHQIAEYLMRMYNAFGAIENNVSNFINYMQSRGLQYLMATKQDIPFIGEHDFNKQSHRTYGVYMSPQVKEYLLANMKQYVSEEIDKVRNPNTMEVIRTIHGIERLQDLGFLSELHQYYYGLNTDRLIANMLAQSMAKSFQTSGIITRENKVKSEENDVNYSVERSFFKNLNSNMNSTIPVQKSYFRKHG